jgi:hypothetical protein
MENFDEKESLKIITQMINTAKTNIGNNSIYFLLWGWAVLIAAVSHYILLINHLQYNYLPWPVAIITAGIAASIIGYRSSKKKMAQGYIDKFVGTLWMFVGITIFLTLVLVTYLADFRVSYTVIMLLYGLGTLITGTVIRFVPLIVGGIIVWLCATLMVWVSFPDALLVLAFSVLAGYIIPGYLLKSKRENKQTPVSV